MSVPTADPLACGKLTCAAVGSGAQTVAELDQPGTAALEYFTKDGPTTLNVFFQFNGSAKATVTVDGASWPLAPGRPTEIIVQSFMTLSIFNQSGQVKYGWIVAS